MYISIYKKKFEKTFPIYNIYKIYFIKEISNNMTENLTNIQKICQLTKRDKIKYSFNDQMVINNCKEILIRQIHNKILTHNFTIYENQEECSISIVSKLHNRKIINIMVLALTQSGKTGTMIALIKNYMNDTTNQIPIDNIYIITGLSCCDWVEQTKFRMPECMQDRVYHRDNLKKKFINDIKNKKNILIIIDEIQIAAKENQTLNKAFSEAGLYNKENLLKNDIKIIEFTATPDGTIYDLMNWDENAFKIKMEPGEGYTSCFDLKKNGRVFQYGDLCGYKKNNDKLNIDKNILKNFVKLKTEIDKYKEPLYHIIRTPNGSKSDIVIDNFKKLIDKNIKYHTYDKDSDIQDINNILKIKPEIHTYIFIKEKLRCAKTLTKTYLGVLYERYTKLADDTVIIQGLIGRGTGYDDNGKSIYFTNIPSIYKHQIIWNSNYEDKTIKWKSKTTKINNGILHSIGTLNNPSLFEGMGILNEQYNKENQLVIKKFNTFNKAKEYVKKNLLKSRGPNDPSKYKDENGFYKNNIRGKTCIMDTEEVEKNIKWGLTKSDKNPYRLHCCYQDKDKIETLQFWIVHYK